jgi:hypothetical protein
MDNSNYNATRPIQSSQPDYKNILIIVLILIILLFTSLGVFFNEFVSNFLYSTGWFIKKTSDLVANTGETTIDIANDAIHSGSDLLIKASKRSDGRDPENPYNVTSEDKPQKEPESEKHNEPAPDTATNPIQKPITSGKSNWCLVGEYQGRRGCIEIGDSDKCMSGQVFPSQYTCLNPNFSQNVLPNMTTPNGIPPRIDLNMLPPK